MAKRAGRVESIGLAGQTGHGSKRIIFKRVNQVAGWVRFTRIFQTSFLFFNYKNKSMTTYLERMNKIN